jgi:hypothetical protein
MASLVTASSGCGQECVDCPAEPIFAPPFIADAAFLNGVLWVPHTVGAWAIDGTDLEVVERTPQRQILRVPPSLEAGTYAMTSLDETREVTIVNAADVAPFALVHDTIVPQRAFSRVDGPCISSCKSIPSFELPPPAVEPSPDDRFVNVVIGLPGPQPEVPSWVIVDVWEAEVDVNDTEAPRVVDSATVLGRSPATEFQVRFRSMVDPGQMSQVFDIVAEQ